ncbi:MAG: helix-turn-helix transcriptional regulator [Oscillospiraceae bacterium]|nr:helix-turn-helix transcriptional regulator [Oscillospiraceae bacterium]
MTYELFRIGERIKNLRETNRLTQAELARKLGLSRSAVNAWEMGLSMPSALYVVELAKQFHVSTDYLLGMNSSSTISIDGLDYRQVKIVADLIDYFRTLY